MKTIGLSTDGLVRVFEIDENDDIVKFSFHHGKTQTAKIDSRFNDEAENVGEPIELGFAVGEFFYFFSEILRTNNY